MTKIRLRGFQIFKDRHGKWRAYHRKTRAPVDLDKTPLGSAEFFAECAKIAALAEAKAVKEKPGTFGFLIRNYRASATFQDLAPRTQADYQGHFDYLQPIADTPLIRFDRPLVVRIRDKAAASKGRRFGNYLKATLRSSSAGVPSAATSPATPHPTSKQFAGRGEPPMRTAPGPTRNDTWSSRMRQRICGQPSRL